MTAKTTSAFFADKIVFPNRDNIRKIKKEFLFHKKIRNDYKIDYKFDKLDDYLADKKKVVEDEVVDRLAEIELLYAKIASIISKNQIGFNKLLTLNQSPPAGTSLALGTYSVVVRAVDASGNADSCTFTVVARDTTPPRIASLVASPSTLWPPNHKMITVALTGGFTDNCDARPTCQIQNILITSDEPTDGTGDGHTSPDWEIVDGTTVKLRAERSGNGDGRVYTVPLKCVDAAGNMQIQPAVVTVAHDQGN